MFFATKISFTIALVLSGCNVVQVHAQSGNAIDKPLFDEKLPVGKEYIITWTPSTPGKVTLSLLRGPNGKLLSKIDTIATSIENSGTFAWTPSMSLVESTHYGINLTVDADPSSFQYSNPFAIINAAVQPDSSIPSTATRTQVSTTESMTSSTSGSEPAGSSNSESISYTSTAVESGVIPPKSHSSSTSTSMRSSTPTKSNAASTPSSNATKPITGVNSAVQKGVPSGAATVAFVVAGLFASFFI